MNVLAALKAGKAAPPLERWPFIGPVELILEYNPTNAVLDHIREKKDGLWAVLVWLSIMAARKQSVEEIVQENTGPNLARHYYCRFDYEALDPRAAYFIMRDLEALITDKSFSNQQFAVGSNVYTVQKANSFEYVDPVDGTVTKRQGLRIIFSDASRLIFRLSSSSHVRATLRIYAESYEKDPSKHDKEPQKVKILSQEGGAK
uniref:Phosphoglucomutase-5 n=1 Tax=Sphaerodactylus townsendi TaxID=933632 RepID=A0ACB8ERI6_9SAUR